MSISNAAVQQSQRDIIYLAVEYILYISISIGIGTGLDIKNSPPDAKPERWLQFSSIANPSKILTCIFNKIDNKCD
jgi:hypothetical protein